VIYPAGYVAPYVIRELLPHVMGFSLEGHQGILTTVASQADTLAHLVQGCQVLHPQPINSAQHH
jgi:hypothetical protein